MRTDVSGRQLFQEGVRPGRTVPIPETLGRARILLDDTGLAPPAIGAVYALLEENGITDRLMKMGHQGSAKPFTRRLTITSGRTFPKVSPYTPPPPDPCQAQKNAYNQAARLVEQLRDAITALREKFAQASPSERPDIAEEIAETRASLDQALAAAQQAQDAYDQCRDQNSNLRKEFTF